MSLTSYFFYDLVLFWISLMIITITYYKQTFKYWSQRGVDGPEPTVFFGNVWDVANGSKTMGELWKKIYLELKSKGLRHGGGYFMAKPMYTVVSLDLVKAIMQTDYQYFNSHGTYVNEKVDPLSINIFNLDGHRWKEIRTKITPTFTTGKIKMMFNTMVECSILLEELLRESESDNPVDIRNVMSRFTIDTIGSQVTLYLIRQWKSERMKFIMKHCHLTSYKHLPVDAPIKNIEQFLNFAHLHTGSSAFGIETNTMKDPNSEFRKHGLMMFNMNPVEAMRQFCVIFIPHWLLRAINFSVISSKIRNFFYHMAVDTIKYREEHNIVRNDFMHLMVQMKNGKFVDDKGEKSKGRLTMNEVAAQCFFFFLAGFETSSTTICFASYELSLHKEIQDRARQEIKEVLTKYNNEITYDALMEMHYLETVIYETLRKYPPLQFLLRKCTDNYKVPDSNIIIEKGMVTIIPVLGLHFDPEYYPEPEKFDPERFNAENKKTIPQFAWLPFGEGPRICLGLRFGMVQVKIGLISLLKNYEFTLHEKTISPIVYTKTSVLASAKGGIWLNLRKIH